MSKLLYKEQPVKTIILQALTQGIEHMNRASAKTNSMDVPSGFIYAREMANCKVDIIKTAKELQELEKWLNYSNKKVNEVLKKMSDEALLLPQSQLLSRKELVK